MTGVLKSASRALWCNKITTFKQKPGKSFVDWLTGSGYQIQNCETGWLFEGFDDRSVIEALAFDVNRFSTAGRETIHAISRFPGSEKSLGWLYVQLYYAAFFYAHAVLRLWGKIPLYLRTEEAKKLAKIALAQGQSGKITPGQCMFFVRLESNLKRQRSQIRMETGDKAKGSHEFTWSVFLKALHEIKSLIANESTYPEAMDDSERKLDDLISRMTGKGSNDAWLSEIRNSVQYRHSHGIWFPYGTKDKSESLLKVTSLDNLIFQSVRIETANAGRELVHFKDACVYLIAFCRTTILDLENVGGKDIFLAHGEHLFGRAHQLRRG